MARIKSPDELEKLRQEILARRDSNKPRIAICAGTGCLASGAAKVIVAFKEEIKKQGLEVDVDIKETGCPGFCPFENALLQKVRKPRLRVRFIQASHFKKNLDGDNTVCMGFFG